MQFIIENHKIYAQNEAGERLAEVDFPALDENTVSIDHTFVDPCCAARAWRRRL